MLIKGINELVKIHFHILPEEVLTELLKLNIHKSSGLDGISPNILKMSATVIYESLTHIFNLSLCTGNFPSKLNAFLKSRNKTPV
jgi:hypothetical protein